MLRLRTFGGLSLDGRVGTLAGAAAQPRRLALLSALAVAGERGMSRDLLLALLWPERDARGGRQALSQAIYALRRDTGADRLILGIGTEQLRLNPDAISADVSEFESALERNDRECAAARYAGPFLDGVHLSGDDGTFERWVDDQRMRLNGLARQAFEGLAAEAEARGDQAAASRWWRRLVEIDPLGTRAAEGLIQSLAAEGDRAGALRHADLYVRRLREELDAEPGAGLLSLMESLRAPVDTRATVMVLDFANISDVRDAGWLKSGIAETVRIDIARIAGLRVVGSDQSMRERADAATEGAAGGVLDPGDALRFGRERGVRWVVWGGFQKSGERVRLTAHFAETTTGAVVGAEKIDGSMDEIFELQDRIVTSLARAVRIELTSGEVEQIERLPTRDLTAYECYARGLEAWNRLGVESVREAAEYFRRAAAIDPGYAQAHLGLGRLLMPRFIADGREEDLEEGIAALQRAIDIDPGLADAYAFLSYAYFRQRRFTEAIAAGERAVEHEPTSHNGWYMLGMSHLTRADAAGRLDDPAACIEPLERARALAPDYQVPAAVLGMIYTLRGDYPRAATVLDEAVAVEERREGVSFPGALVLRALLHLHRHERSQAGTLLERAVERWTGADHVYAETVTAFAHFARGRLAEAADAPAEALDAYRASCAIAEQHPARAGIGGQWAKSRFGLARVLHRLGARAEAEEAFESGRTTYGARSRFAWTPFFGALNAEILYEKAAAEATLGRFAAARETLARAAEAGWADVQRVDGDPGFREFRRSAAWRRP